MLDRDEIVNSTTLDDIQAGGTGEPPVPFVPHQVSVMGYRMHYLVAGAGEPVLLLHGLADSCDTWSRILPGLARRYRVFAPDLLGCGASDKPRIDYSLPALTTYVHHFLSAVGVESAHIVGHSLGAGLALHLLFQYPERVRRLALLASGGMGRELPLSLRLCTLAGSYPVIGALLASRHTNHPLARAGHHLLGRLWPATAVADSPDTAEAAEEDGILERLRDPGARAAFLSMLRSVGNVRGQHTIALAHLHLIHVPVLLIHGRQDDTIPVSHGQAAKRHLAEAYLEVLDNCGHCPQREAPAQVVRLLERFLGPPLARSGSEADEK